MWLWTAFHHKSTTLDVVTVVVGGFGAVLFALGRLHVIADQTIGVVSGWISAASFVLFGLFRAIGAPIWIANEHRAWAERERDSARADAERLRAAAETRPAPRPVLWFTRDQFGRWMLNVRNEGDSAIFHANAMVMRANTGDGAIGHAQRLRWDKARGVESKIVTGGEDSCCVAVVQTVQQPVAEVRFSAICDAGFPDARYPEVAYWTATWFVGAQGIEPAQPLALCQVTVATEPPLRDGPLRRRFQLGPAGFHEERSEGFLFNELGMLPGDQ